MNSKPDKENTSPGSVPEDKQKKKHEIVDNSRDAEPSPQQTTQGDGLA